MTNEIRLARKKARRAARIQKKIDTLVRRVAANKVKTKAPPEFWKKKRVRIQTAITKFQDALLEKIRKAPSTPAGVVAP